MAQPGKILSRAFLIAGLVIWLGTAFFGDWDHWPSMFKNPMTFMSGSLSGFAMVVLWYVSRLQLSTWRANSPVMLADNMRFHFNPDEDVIPMGDLYVGYPLNGIKSTKWFMTIPGQHGLLIAPPWAVRKFGNNFALLGNAQLVEDIEQLSPEWVRRIRAYKRAGPYYVWHAPRVVEMRSKDYAVQKRMIDMEWQKAYHQSKNQREALDATGFAVRHLSAVIREMPKKDQNILTALFGGGGNKARPDQDARYRPPEEE